MNNEFSNLAAAIMNPQDVSIGILEKAGFKFTCWFDAHDDNDGRCATMTKTFSSISHAQCEVDPDGSCNGTTVSKYLKSVRQR